MANHSSILAWKIIWTKEPGRLQSSSVQFSHSVVSDSLRLRGLQHSRRPCLPPTPGACSNSCPSCWWCQSNYLILYYPFLLLSSILPSVRVFSSESVLHIRWSKYWSFSFNISPSNERSGLISFRIDWFDLLSVQGTLKSLLQHYSSKASILQRSAFFMVQLTSIHDYQKNLSFDDMDLFLKVTSLLFNMLFRLLIALLQRSKCLLISWLESLSTVILEPPKIVSHCFHCFPI